MAEIILSVATAIVSGISIVANLLALSWYGMWSGMTSKNARLASLKTLLVAQVAPWLGIYVASWIAAGVIMVSLSVATAAPSTMAITTPLIYSAVSAALSVGKDACFIIWARKKLFSSFHEQMLRNLIPARVVRVPTAPRPVPAPPIITAQRR
jgi:hypothetical protein